VARWLDAVNVVLPASAIKTVVSTDLNRNPLRRVFVVCSLSGSFTPK
jgi:hypothetical protein